MKLKSYESSLSEKMSEFDIWVTPSLGEIRDTPQFRNNLDALKRGFEVLSHITNNFADYSHCSSSVLSNNTIEYIKHKGEDASINILNSIWNVLLLATGKTDNNLKCQYPLLLRNTYEICEYPQKDGQGQWKSKSIPRVISFEDITKIIVNLKEKPHYLKVFTESYFHLIISDELYARQLWSLGNAYAYQKATGNEDSLISSMVIFQSRGSITATQGHIPETILRSYMTDWGLNAGTDFNTQDVEVGEIIEGIEVDNKIKKRKYDFIIPFKSRTNGSKIFIQSQYYAGDSGSVSHKVVDQTDSTREVTLRKYPEAVFVEYLDGAGYFSSLNGDLRKMLAKKTTKDFFQIRTAPIKLRRELQGIHFLTTLEVEHAILYTSGEKMAVVSALVNDGYSEEEIARVLKQAVDNRYIVALDTEELALIPERIELVRKYCLLDLLANYGRPIPDDAAVGCLLIAGYKTLWGLPQAEIIKIALEKIPKLDSLWETKLAPFSDIQWLIDKGFIKSK